MLTRNPFSRHKSILCSVVHILHQWSFFPVDNPALHQIILHKVVMIKYKTEVIAFETHAAFDVSAQHSDHICFNYIYLQMK